MRPRRLLTLVLAIALAGSMLPAAAAAGDQQAAPFPWPPGRWVTELADRADVTQEEPSSALVVRKGPARSGAVALTFDDGHNSKACARIANTLRKHDAVGTFFINGQWLDRAPLQWRHILEGMEVANHTRSHRDLTQEPHPVVIRQIKTDEAIHERVLERPMLKALRPPYGAYGERIGRIAKDLGYEHIVMWNVDTGDWRPNAKAKRIVRRATGARAGSIILMHCARDATARALPAIIRHYQRRGIEVAGLSVVLEGARGIKQEADSGRYGG
jgi:peptidoglycan/xylan/chitin deacetylase (PgdA/CDA1 family)